MKILIVGGGLGGIMLAAALQHHGLDYHLIEKSPFGSEQGFSLAVWNNTRQLCQKLGLLPAFDRLGTKIQTYRVCDSNGKTLRHYDFEPFHQRYEIGYTQVDRRQLRQLIASKLDQDKIQNGHTISKITQDDQSVTVDITDGAHRQFDLLIGADGIHSQIRQMIFGPNLQTYTGWRAWYVPIERRCLNGLGMLELLGPGRCLGIYDEGDRALAIFFSLTKSDEGIAFLKTHFTQELSQLPGALDAKTDRDVMTTDLAYVKIPTWVKNRVALLGDAAHAFEPHTGLGASMAMEDGWILASELSRAVPHQIPAALQRYESLRQRRLAIVRRLTGRMRKLAFVRSKLMRRCADWIIPRIPQGMFVSDYYKLLDENITS